MSRRDDREAGSRRLSPRVRKACGAGALTLLGFALVGIAAGVLIDRLLDFDSALDAGGEWDEGGGVSTRWY